jgi:hypothetical protein
MMLVGAGGTLISALSFRYLQPKIEDQDTQGITSLHLLPGLWGAVVMEFVTILGIDNQVEPQCHVIGQPSMRCSVLCLYRALAPCSTQSMRHASTRCSSPHVRRGFVCTTDDPSRESAFVRCQWPNHAPHTCSFQIICSTQQLLMLMLMLMLMLILGP